MDILFYIVIGAALVLVLGVLHRNHMSFVAQKPQDYADGEPQFDLRRHLNGPIVCEGVIFGPLGRVTSRFSVILMHNGTATPV